MIESERKFPNIEKFPYGSKKYWFEIEGRLGWKSRYVKIVDVNEITISFIQEIYNHDGVLVEIHEKYPIDKGHINLI